jgi:cysteine-rich repeat protein
MQARTAWQPPVYSQHYTSQSFGALGYGGDLVWNGSQYSYRLDLTGRQADELTHQHLPGVYRQKIAFDDGQSESLVLNTVDGWIIWTPQRAVPLCGNGILDQGERCDDGNLRHDDDCPMDCRSVCGDGVRSELEACDDGNELDGDGCSARCELSD